MSTPSTNLRERQVETANDIPLFSEYPSAASPPPLSPSPPPSITFAHNNHAVAPPSEPDVVTSSDISAAVSLPPNPPPPLLTILPSPPSSLITRVAITPIASHNPRPFPPLPVDTLLVPTSAGQSLSNSLLNLAPGELSEACVHAALLTIRQKYVNLQVGTHNFAFPHRGLERFGNECHLTAFLQFLARSLPREFAASIFARAICSNIHCVCCNVVMDIMRCRLGFMPLQTSPRLERASLTVIGSFCNIAHCREPILRLIDTNFVTNTIDRIRLLSESTSLCMNSNILYEMLSSKINALDSNGNHVFSASALYFSYAAMAGDPHSDNISHNMRTAVLEKIPNTIEYASLELVPSAQHAVMFEWMSQTNVRCPESVSFTLPGGRIQHLTLVSALCHVNGHYKVLARNDINADNWKCFDDNKSITTVISSDPLWQCVELALFHIRNAPIVGESAMLSLPAPSHNANTALPDTLPTAPRLNTSACSFSPRARSMVSEAIGIPATHITTPVLSQHREIFNNNNLLTTEAVHGLILRDRSIDLLSESEHIDEPDFPTEIFMTSEIWQYIPDRCMAVFIKIARTFLADIVNACNQSGNSPDIYSSAIRRMVVLLPLLLRRVTRIPGMCFTGDITMTEQLHQRLSHFLPLVSPSLLPNEHNARARLSQIIMELNAETELLIKEGPYSQHPQPQTATPLDPSSGLNPLSEKEATRLASRINYCFQINKVGQAMKLILSNADRLILDNNVVSKLKNMHPPPCADDRGEWPECPPSARVHITASELEKLAPAFINNGSAGGTDNICGAVIVPLITDPDCRNGLACLFTLIANGDIPDGPLKTLLLASRLVPIPKKPSGLRPIAVGSVYYRLTAKILMNRIARSGCLQKVFPSIQLAVGCSSGCETAILRIQMAIDYAKYTKKKNFACLLVDYQQAYQSASRAKIASELFQHSELACIYRVFMWAYRRLSLVCLYDQRRLRAIIHSQNGVRQGDPLAPLLFCLAVQPMYTAIFQALQPEAICKARNNDFSGSAAPLNGIRLPATNPDPDIKCIAVAISDDLTISVDANWVSVAFQVAKKIKSGNLTINDNKTIAFFPLLENTVPTPACVADASALGVCIEFGTTKLLGSIIGNPDILPNIFNQSNPFLGKIQNAVHRLLRLPIPKQMALILLRFCMLPKMCYLMRCLPPRVLCNVASQFDNIILSAVCQLINISQAELLRPDVNDRIFLPLRVGGLGFRPVVQQMPAAFLACTTTVICLSYNIVRPFVADTETFNHMRDSLRLIKDAIMAVPILQEQFQKLFGFNDFDCSKWSIDEFLGNMVDTNNHFGLLNTAQRIISFRELYREHTGLLIHAAAISDPRGQFPGLVNIHSVPNDGGTTSTTISVDGSSDSRPAINTTVSNNLLFGVQTEDAIRTCETHDHWDEMNFGGYNFLRSTLPKEITPGKEQHQLKRVFQVMQLQSLISGFIADCRYTVILTAALADQRAKSQQLTSFLRGTTNSRIRPNDMELFQLESSVAAANERAASLMLHTAQGANSALSVIPSAQDLLLQDSQILSWARLCIGLPPSSTLIHCQQSKHFGSTTFQSSLPVNNNRLLQLCPLHPTWCKKHMMHAAIPQHDKVKQALASIIKEAGTSKCAVEEKIITSARDARAIFASQILQSGYVLAAANVGERGANERPSLAHHLTDSEFSEVYRQLASCDRRGDITFHGPHFEKMVVVDVCINSILCPSYRATFLQPAFNDPNSLHDFPYRVHKRFENVKFGSYRNMFTTLPEPLARCATSVHYSRPLDPLDLELIPFSVDPCGSIGQCGLQLLRRLATQKTADTFSAAGFSRGRIPASHVCSNVHRVLANYRGRVAIAIAAAISDTCSSSLLNDADFSSLPSASLPARENHPAPMQNAILRLPAIPLGWNTLAPTFSERASTIVPSRPNSTPSSAGTLSLRRSPRTDSRRPPRPSVAPVSDSNHPSLRRSSSAPELRGVRQSAASHHSHHNNSIGVPMLLSPRNLPSRSSSSSPSCDRHLASEVNVLHQSSAGIPSLNILANSTSGSLTPPLPLVLSTTFSDNSDAESENSLAVPSIECLIDGALPAILDDDIILPPSPNLVDTLSHPNADAPTRASPLANPPSLGLLAPSLPPPASSAWRRFNSANSAVALSPSACNMLRGAGYCGSPPPHVLGSSPIHRVVCTSPPRSRRRDSDVSPPSSPSD